MAHLRDFEAAAGFYREARALRPPNWEKGWYFVNNNLGYSLNQLGQFQEAELYCREAIATDPARFNAHKNLGLSLQGQGRHVDAARSFIRAMEACPMEPRAGRHLLALAQEHPEVMEIPDIREKAEALQVSQVSLGLN